MSFKDAVDKTNVAACYRNGLQALGAHSAKIAPRDTRKCQGSVEIDACLKKEFPNAARWDYTLGYDGHSYFVEVHSASGQVSKVIEKTSWLRNWLKTDGKALNDIHYPGKNFHWIPTNGVHIMGKEKFKLADNKIVIVSVLQLPQNK